MFQVFWCFIELKLVEVRKLGVESHNVVIERI